MPHPILINENQLDDWVAKNNRAAQSLVVRLVSELVTVSCPLATHRNFPLHINQEGADGELDTEVGFRNFIPEGRSFWEIGTGSKAGDKATSDYKDLTEGIPPEIRASSSFIFVTPRSGASGWPNSWRDEGMAIWIEKRKKRKEWYDVRVINGAILTDWISFFPAIGHWLATEILGLPSGFETAQTRWNQLHSLGDPPPLSHDLFTIGRTDPGNKLRDLVIENNSAQLRFDTRYPNHTADFVSAYIQTLDEDTRQNLLARTLIFPNRDDWLDACNLPESHILVADFDVNSNRGSALIQRARSARHAVIHSGFPGGNPHGNCVELLSPKASQMKEALIKSGYSEERARILTNKSGNDLNALLRLIQDLSAMPEWATKSEASDLAIAQLLGEWDENSPGDKAIIGELSGNAYGEWIAKIRKIASAKAAPLEFYNGRWKFISRYEPWNYLGPLLSADDLESFKTLSIKVLAEPDPQLDLPKEKRFAAPIYGKERDYSTYLRHGISETLALLGTHGDALKTCPQGLPKSISRRVVYELLGKASSRQWSSLNDVLPLLAEASPSAFLSFLGSASEDPQQPFKGVFAEEGDALISGGTYITGVLWGLEALAWSSEYLVRACSVLANLAALDPGGTWSNRPSNSLIAILLPWLPQTCASAEKRYAAVKWIVSEQPEVAWELLLSLLPESHSSSSCTHKPKWLDYIPEDWKEGVTYKERWADEAFFAMLALELANYDIERLSELAGYYFNLNLSFRQAYRDRLLSNEVIGLPEVERLKLWTTITNLTGMCRKFSDNKNWKQPEDALKELDAVAEKLKPQAPEVSHRSLFSGRNVDHYEEKGNWAEQQAKLLQKRIAAVREILNQGDFNTLLDFSRSVEFPNEVGFAYGADPSLAKDSNVLPKLLESENKEDRKFAKSYVWSRFRSFEWPWVDSQDRSDWSLHSKAAFFTVLPFTCEAWKRVAGELDEDENEYWKTVIAQPDREHPDGLTYAIAKLIAIGRSDSAIQCIWLADKSEDDYLELGLIALENFNKGNQIDKHAIADLFNHLQKSESIDEDRLAVVELKFLEFLGRFSNSRPCTLFRHLAERPDLFIWFIQMMYRSKHESEEKHEHKKDLDENKSNLATRAYRLLRDWDYPPGLVSNGEFDIKRFENWKNAVKEKCVDSGHWEVASHHIGEVLNYAPKGEDDLWIPPVCEILNSKEGDEIRRGLQIRIFNSRGAHFYSGGKEEIKLAEQWEELARISENKGYLRLSQILSEIGKRYHEDAKRSVLDHRHKFD